MPKIARGVTGSSSDTPASRCVSPSAGVRSPVARRSATVPVLNVTSSAPRTSAAVGLPVPGCTNVPSRIGARLQVGSAMADDSVMESGAIQAAADLSAASYRSFADATRAVLDVLETQIPGTAIFLAHLDRGHDVHRIVDTRNGGEFGLRSNLTLPLSDSFCVHMSDDRAPRRCDDVAKHPVYGRVAAQERFAAGSYLGMPLELSDGARVGVLAAMSRETDRFRADHEQLFAMLARVLAYELERETNERDLRRLNGSLRDQARGLAALGRAARALAGDTDPKVAV